MPDLNRSLLSEAENADTLGGLTDVTITAPEEFQGLSYNGTQWVNSHIPVVSYVRNAEANTLTTGTVVYLFGGTGDHATVKRADNSSDATSSKTLGIVANPIAASQNGPVVTRGYVDGMDLSVGYSVGDILWLDANGGFTKTKPTSPAHLVFLGVVVRASVNGIIYVAVQNGYELNELHDVYISNTLAAGDFLKYNGSLWINGPITLGTDTTGNYMSNVSAGNLISISHTPGEGSTATINVANGTAGQIIVANASGVPTYVTLSGDITIAANGQTTIAANSVALGTDTTGNYIATIAGTTNEISVTGSGSESAAVTIGLPANVTIANNLTVTGDLTVNGNTTTLNTANLNVEDNFILLNSGVTGAPTLNAGIQIERGTSADVDIRWNETTDKWEFTTNGSTYTELGSGGATVSASAPSSPSTGAIWFDSDTGQTYVYYDSSWIEVGASSPARLTISASAPSNPIEGSMWLDSDDGATYAYYNGVWIEVGASAVDTLLTTINAKGDLLVGTADNTVSRLAAGTDGFFLKANSSTATGLQWDSIPTINNLDDIGDVSVAGATNGRVLQYNGSAWVAAIVSSDVMTDSKNAALLVMDIGV